MIEEVAPTLWDFARQYPGWSLFAVALFLVVLWAAT